MENKRILVEVELGMVIPGTPVYFDGDRVGVVVSVVPCVAVVRGRDGGAVFDMEARLERIFAVVQLDEPRIVVAR